MSCETRIGTIFLLFILAAEFSGCYSISLGGESQNRNGGKHQSTSNHQASVEVDYNTIGGDKLKANTMYDILPTTIMAEEFPPTATTTFSPAEILSSSLSSLSSLTSSSALVQEQQNNEKEEGEDIYECGSPENLHHGRFTIYDYVIVLAMLVISLGIGVFYGFFKKTGSSSNEFLLGSEMSVFPVTLSLTTSFITAIELLGNPAEMFYQGTQFSLIVIPMILVIPVAVKIFYPIYFKLELTSCYEYLGIRFGKEVRILGAILYIIQMCFYTAVAVLAPAIALSKATGLNTRFAVILIYLVCIFYSSQGGMKAVVIADTFQACVLALSLIIVVILGWIYTGSPITVFETAAENNRLEFFNFNPDPTVRHTVFSIVIGGFFYWTSMFCTNQASVQKCMSLKSLQLAKIALGFAVLGLIVVFLINFYTGIMVFTHYASCDPLSSGEIGAADQLLPFYIMHVYGDIYTITGIFVAGIFAASLGTVASALNSLAAITCEDLITTGFNIKIDPKKGACYAKWMSLGYGLFSFVLVFVVELLGGVLQATLTLNGLVGGVTLGLFVLGIASKRANTKGAFYGGLIALMVVIYIGVMAQIRNVDPQPLPVSIEECNCFVNMSQIGQQQNNSNTIEALSAAKDLLTTIKGNDFGVENHLRSSYDSSNNNNNSNNTMKMDEFSFSSLYKISYMWYSMIGAVLTIIIGYILSIIIDIIKSRRILEIAHIDPHLHRSSIHINMERKISTNWNDNMKAQNVHEMANSKQNGVKIGIDNYALKIDDEK